MKAKLLFDPVTLKAYQDYIPEKPIRKLKKRKAIRKLNQAV